MPPLPESTTRVPRRGRWMSLEFRLPLLMTAVLFTVLAIALAATYTTLRRAALANARDRLRRATHQIAATGAASVAAQRPRYLAVANDSAIRRALAAGEAAAPAAREVLAKLQTPADSGMPVELWTADGRRVAFVGTDLRASGPVAQTSEHPPAGPPALDAVRAGSGAGPLLTPLYADGGRVNYWAVMPVVAQGRTAGYIAQQRRIARNPQLEQTLRDLSGDSVSMYYHNADGKFWATISGVPATAPRRLSARKGATIVRRGLGELLFDEDSITGTPLFVEMELPVRGVLARPLATIGPLVLLSIVLMLGGAMASWLIGRRIAQPLNVLTDAAGAVASGDYEARVPPDGHDEVARLATSFNHMAEEIAASHLALARQTQEARAANGAKTDFLRVMSHELRTPLNAIGGYVDLLDMGLRGPITDAQRRDLERIRVSQQHLLGLISAVLDLGRIESGRVVYDLAPVALDPFLAGLDALIGPQANRKSITLDYVPAPRGLAALADREKLRQVLLNLLSNAIRHTPIGGRITLAASGDERTVSIAVTDTGPGIPRDKFEQIFEPFVQLDRSLTTPREGLGIGLAISRDLARGMGGDLRVDSSSAQGARFLLTLPRGAADASITPRLSGDMPAVGTR